MSEAVVPELEPVAPRRRRRLLWLLIGLAAVVPAVVGFYAYIDYARERDLRAAVEEADRLDPGWRFEALEAARADVPAGENGAALVLAAAAKMPGAWPAAPAAGGAGLEERLADLAPRERPDDAELKLLRSELGLVAGALDGARGLADRPRGRYTVAWSGDLVGTMMTHVQQVREVALMLALDARLRAFDGDRDGALRSCRAELNAGRSLGDEPAPISQFVRASWSRRAVRAVEAVLAQGEASPKSLEGLQRALTEEAEEPTQLAAARASRVFYDQAFAAMRSGKMTRANFGLRSSVFGPTGDNFIDGSRARACQAAYLHYGNELVEIAKLPDDGQQDRLKSLTPPSQQLPLLLDALSRGEDGLSVWRAFHRTKAELRCAAAALAAERYRLATKHWPERLDELVPDYLPAVPADPFDGRPLRLRRLDDGIMVYSVGPDGTDNGGNLDRKDGRTPGTDLGFQLWDVGRRGSAPRR
jgi:hypothetical protein